MAASENGFQGGDFRKRMPFVLVWTGENAKNEGFRKRRRHKLDNQSPTENERGRSWTVESIRKR